MKKGRTLALLGAWLQLAPFLGLLGTVIGMFNAFEEISKEESLSSTEMLSENISFAITATAIGIIPAMIGLILLLVALFASKYRAPWFFWFMVIYSIFTLLGFPIGTVLGIVILIYIIPRKNEFKYE